jgi:hypothetical protein
VLALALPGQVHELLVPGTQQGNDEEEDAAMDAVKDTVTFPGLPRAAARILPVIHDDGESGLKVLPRSRDSIDVMHTTTPTGVPYG